MDGQRDTSYGSSGQPRTLLKISTFSHESSTQNSCCTLLFLLGKTTIARIDSWRYIHSVFCTSRFFYINQFRSTHQCIHYQRVSTPCEEYTGESWLNQSKKNSWHSPIKLVSPFFCMTDIISSLLVSPFLWQTLSSPYWCRPFYIATI